MFIAAYSLRNGHWTIITIPRMRKTMQKVYMYHPTQAFILLHTNCVESTSMQKERGKKETNTKQTKIDEMDSVKFVCECIHICVKAT